MGLSLIRVSLICLFSISCLFAGESQSILFLMHSRETEKAFERYQKVSKEENRHDFDTLQNMCLLLLRQGAANSDPAIRRLAMLGAGLAASSHSLEILEAGFYSEDPQTQLMALHFLSFLQDDRIIELLTKAMSSPFLITRLEAAYLMAERKHPTAASQIEALMYRLPPFFKPFFPSFFAMIGTPESTAILKDLLNDQNIAVRVETIFCVGAFEKDSLTAAIRKKATHSHIAEQEVSAWALGKLKDSASLPILKKLAASQANNVMLAASKTLFDLGGHEYGKNIINAAKEHDLFAISLLKDIPDSENLLVSLLKNADIEIRINAAIALLLKKDTRCLPTLLEIFISDTRDLAFQPGFSFGHALRYWKVIPSGSLKTKNHEVDLELSLSLKEYLLKEALSLPEDNFLSIAKIIFDTQQNSLIPQLVNLLENLSTPKAVELLKTGSQKIGAPFIRDYCNLALFRLKEQGSYEDYLKDWLLRQKDTDIIHLRPIIPRNMLLPETQYALAPEEKTRIMLDIYTALTGKQNEKCIEIVVEAIKKAKPENRYALAGLLLRGTE